MSAEQGMTEAYVEQPAQSGHDGEDFGGGSGGYELDADGNKLRVVQYSDYAAEKVRTLYPSAAELRKQWANPDQRADIIAKLEERGIGFDELAAAANQPDADPFDLLCHLAFNAPLRTRRASAVPSSTTRA